MLEKIYINNPKGSIIETKKHLLKQDVPINNVNEKMLNKVYNEQ